MEISKKIGFVRDIILSTMLLARSEYENKNKENTIKLMEKAFKEIEGKGLPNKRRN